jgi:hypothetical protein
VEMRGVMHNVFLSIAFIGVLVLVSMSLVALHGPAAIYARREKLTLAGGGLYCLFARESAQFVFYGGSFERHQIPT